MKIEIIPGRLTVDSNWVAAIEVFGHSPHQGMKITLHSGAQFHASKSDHPDFSASQVLGKFHEAALDLGEAAGKVRKYEEWAPKLIELSEYLTNNGLFDWHSTKSDESCIDVALRVIKAAKVGLGVTQITCSEYDDIEWAVDEAEGLVGLAPTIEGQNEIRESADAARRALAKFKPVYPETKN